MQETQETAQRHAPPLLEIHDGEAIIIPMPVIIVTNTFYTPIPMPGIPL